MKMYFVRHGESLANTSQVFSNRLNRYHPLTPRGITQAKELAGKLSSVSNVNIYSSPLVRAVQTANAIAEQCRATVEISPALQEYDVGILEDQPYSSERLALYAANEEEWLVNKNYAHRLLDGESFSEIEIRFVPFINELVEEFSNSDVDLVLVSHGGVYRCLLPRVLSNITVDFAKQHAINHCDVVIGELLNGQLYCRQWGDRALTGDQ